MEHWSEDALEAACKAYHRAALSTLPPRPDSGLVEELELALDPRRWTREMSEAWHRHLPDTQAAFAALREAAHARYRQQTGAA